MEFRTSNIEEQREKSELKRNIKRDFEMKKDKEELEKKLKVYKGL